jgi:hypothetical protein
MKHRAILPATMLFAAAALSGCHLAPGNAARQPAAAPGGVITATGPGWGADNIEGPTYSPHTCHYRRADNAEVLPDPACTPGVIDPAVTQTNLHTTVCGPGGYTASVRPPERLTEPVKKEIMAAYGISWSEARHYELDHLIELSAGGASDTRNLWPEPNDDAHHYNRGIYVNNDKDRVEALTFDALCIGKAKLAAVQTAVANNWTTALATLHLVATR